MIKSFLFFIFLGSLLFAVEETSSSLTKQRIERSKRKFKLEVHLGRQILKTEILNFKDRNKFNFDPSNMSILNRPFSNTKNYISKVYKNVKSITGPYYKLGYTSIYLPVYGDLSIGWLLIPLFILVVVSTSNAVNISDGIDGLAGGLLINAYAAFGVIALFQGNYGIAGYCFTVVGALLAYVWFNIAPARFVMGDVGSFALGTSLGVVAMLTDTLVLLPLIGLVFVLEAGSSLLQITSKKLFHRKIFIAAPIHHHFEAQGWPKTKVTMRFWVIGQTVAVIGVVLALTTGFIE